MCTYLFKYHINYIGICPWLQIYVTELINVYIKQVSKHGTVLLRQPCHMDIGMTSKQHKAQYACADAQVYTVISFVRQHLVFKYAYPVTSFYKLPYIY